MIKNIVIVVCALVSVTIALQSYETNPSRKIRAQFDEKTVIWTTHSQARQKGISKLINLANILIQQIRNLLTGSVPARELGRPGIGYIDITDSDTITLPQRQVNLPTEPSYQKLIDPLLPKLSDQNLLAYVTKLSSYPTRV